MKSRRHGWSKSARDLVNDLLLRIDTKSQQYPADSPLQPLEMNTDPIIGERYYTDGATRPVYWDPRGQYIIDDDGQKAYGVWILPDQEPEQPIVIDPTRNS